VSVFFGEYRDRDRVSGERHCFRGQIQATVSVTGLARNHFLGLSRRPREHLRAGV